MTLSISLSTITPVVADGSGNPLVMIQSCVRSPLDSLAPTVDFKINVSRSIRAAATASIPQFFEITLIAREAEAERLDQIYNLHQERIAISRANWGVSIGDGVRRYTETGTTTPSLPIYTGSPVVLSGFNQVKYYATFSTVITRFKITPLRSGLWSVEIQAIS